MSEASDDPGLVARIEIYETPLGGHHVKTYLREGMSGDAFASVLRQLAEGFERGTIARKL